jgi:dTDP-4-amino-4,6-dideoxygalactose transaminase
VAFLAARPPRTPPSTPIPFRKRADWERPVGQVLLSPPHLTGNETAAVEAALGSGWLAPSGPVPAAFEAALSRATGFSHILATASGTAALHLGYRCLGVSPGDEVWTSALTFIATVAPAVQMGATPRFLDVEPGSWTLDPDLLERELARAGRAGRLPRAVVPVDLFGQPCDLGTIVALCERWGVPVMCDSAGALGATGSKGRHAGRGARLAAFSFNGNKIVTAGGGGALASDDGRLIAQARSLSQAAREPGPHYQHETTGHAYGMSSLLAAVGLAQLAALPARVSARRAVFARYRAALGGLPGLSFMPEAPGGRASRWLTAVLLDPGAGAPERDALRRHLSERNIESRPVWKPLHLQPVFRDAPRAGGAVAASLFERGLCLPSGSGMAPPEQDRVIAAIRALWPAAAPA